MCRLGRDWSSLVVGNSTPPDVPKEILPPSHIIQVPLCGQPICRRYSLLLTHPFQVFVVRVLISCGTRLARIGQQLVRHSRPITSVPRSVKLLPQTEHKSISNLKCFHSPFFILIFSWVPLQLSIFASHDLLIFFVIVLCMSTSFTLVTLNSLSITIRIRFNYELISPSQGSSIIAFKIINKHCVFSFENTKLTININDLSHCYQSDPHPRH